MSSIDPDARLEIERRLARIAKEEGIRFLIAIESGSRAWGFPSPDSDYDVRVIYARPWQDYISLRPIRDVVERPIVDDFDINGWDIRKALGLLLKQNAVISEWLNSPIRYVLDDPFAAQLANLADRSFDAGGFARHYASLARNAIERWPVGEEPMPAKRYFYALRPALNIRALRMTPTHRPPMQLQQLMAVTDLPASLAAEIDDLVEAKAQRMEVDGTRRSAAIEQLIVDELERASGMPVRPGDPALLAEADSLLLEIVRDQ